MAYPLVDAQTVERLGYDELPVPLVPDGWVELFSRGVDLSTAAALCPPDAQTPDHRDCVELSG
jgi:hypothetical protein